ncbi:hypothetical protein KBI33_03645 [Candidatus Shapirobacteria bacterium]|nr:hypothetical protein [Candidatus Shapirobacteria bacterium]
MNLGVMINYKSLRRVNPEAAGLVVLEYLDTNKGDIADVARTFGLNQ